MHDVNQRLPIVEIFKYKSHFQGEGLNGDQLDIRWRLGRFYKVVPCGWCRIQKLKICLVIKVLSEILLIVGGLGSVQNN